MSYRSLKKSIMLGSALCLIAACQSGGDSSAARDDQVFQDASDIPGRLIIPASGERSMEQGIVSWQLDTSTAGPIFDATIVGVDSDGKKVASGLLRMDLTLASEDLAGYMSAEDMQADPEGAAELLQSLFPTLYLEDSRSLPMNGDVQLALFAELGEDMLAYIDELGDDELSDGAGEPSATASKAIADGICDEPDQGCVQIEDKVEAWEETIALGGTALASLKLGLPCLGASACTLVLAGTANPLAAPCMAAVISSCPGFTASAAGLFVAIDLYRCNVRGSDDSLLGGQCSCESRGYDGFKTQPLSIAESACVSCPRGTTFKAGGKDASGVVQPDRCICADGSVPETVTERDEDGALVAECPCERSGRVCQDVFFSDEGRDVVAGQKDIPISQEGPATFVLHGRWAELPTLTGRSVGKKQILPFSCSGTTEIYGSYEGLQYNEDGTVSEAVWEFTSASNNCGNLRLYPGVSEFGRFNHGSSYTFTRVSLPVGEPYWCGCE